MFDLSQVSSTDMSATRYDDDIQDFKTGHGSESPHCFDLRSSKTS